MAPRDDEDDESSEQYQQRLRAALWAHVRSMVREQARGLQSSPTPRFVSGLLEVVWTQIESTSRDLEMFAKHAGRTTVNVPDMMLLARRNGGLEDILRSFVDEELNKANNGEDQDQQQQADESPQLRTKKKGAKQNSKTPTSKKGEKNIGNQGGISKKRASSGRSNEPAAKRRAQTKK